MWLQQVGFKEMIIKKLPDRNGRNIQDYWEAVKIEVRKVCKGWGANLRGSMKRKKQELLSEIQKIDDKAELVQLSQEEWRRRYKLEEELEKIYADEEIIWHKRSGEQWLLKGDANTGYFHSIANGRNRKCNIESLEDGDEIISDPVQLQNHIESYYKNLFGKEERNKIELDTNIWAERGNLSQEEQQMLIAPFTMEEIEAALKDMKNNTAPGPDGLSVEFYKAFWGQIKGTRDV